MSVRLPSTKSPTASTTTLPDMTVKKDAGTSTTTAPVQKGKTTQPEVNKDGYSPSLATSLKTDPQASTTKPDGPSSPTDWAAWKVTPFDPFKKGFDADTAVAMSRAASLAYFDSPVVQQKMRESGYDSCVCVNRKDAQAFVAADKDRVVVSIRGTEPTNAHDVLTDAGILRTEVPFIPGLIHSGFADHLNCVIPEVLAEVKRLLAEKSDRKVYVTGHSLGAAVATLCAAELHKENVPIQAVYPVASPRVGNWLFTSSYDRILGERTFRLINHRDIVTRVPLPLRFSHVANDNACYFHGNGEVSSGLHLWDITKDRLRDLVFQSRLGDLHIEALDDHYPAGYILLAEQFARKTHEQEQAGNHLRWPFGKMGS